MDVVLLRIFLLVSFIWVFSGSFSVVLVLDELVENIVDIMCLLDIVFFGV